MQQTKKDEFDNDIYWYVFGEKVDEWVKSLRDTLNPVPREHFIALVKHDIETNYDFTKSQLSFVSEQLADANVAAALFEEYLDRLPKFSGKYIARSPELIWGAGETKAKCIGDAEYWWGRNGGLPEKFSEAEIALHEASDRAYQAVKEDSANAERNILEVVDSARKSRYVHVSEAPETID